MGTYLIPLECGDVWQKMNLSSLTLLEVSPLQLIFIIIYYNLTKLYYYVQITIKN